MDKILKIAWPKLAYALGVGALCVALVTAHLSNRPFSVQDDRVGAAAQVTQTIYSGAELDRESPQEVFADDRYTEYVDLFIESANTLWTPNDPFDTTISNYRAQVESFSSRTLPSFRRWFRVSGKKTSVKLVPKKRKTARSQVRKFGNLVSLGTRLRVAHQAKVNAYQYWNWNETTIRPTEMVRIPNGLSYRSKVLTKLKLHKTHRLKSKRRVKSWSRKYQSNRAKFLRAIGKELATLEALATEQSGWKDIIQSETSRVAIDIKFAPGDLVERRDQYRRLLNFSSSLNN